MSDNPDDPYPMPFLLLPLGEYDTAGSFTEGTWQVPIHQDFLDAAIDAAQVQGNAATRHAFEDPESAARHYQRAVRFDVAGGGLSELRANFRSKGSVERHLDLVERLPDMVFRAANESGGLDESDLSDARRALDEAMQDQDETRVYLPSRELSGSESEHEEAAGAELVARSYRALVALAQRQPRPARLAQPSWNRATSRTEVTETWWKGQWWHNPPQER